MMLDGHIENGIIVLDESATLPEGAKVRIEVIREKTDNGSEPSIPKRQNGSRHVADGVKTTANDPKCFHDLVPVRPLDAEVKESLRALLTKSQYDALVDVVDHGGPDVDAIRRLRATSMT
jgi:hypothetical protein